MSNTEISFDIGKESNTVWVVCKIEGRLFVSEKGQLSNDNRILIDSEHDNEEAARNRLNQIRWS